MAKRKPRWMLDGEAPEPHTPERAKRERAKRARRVKPGAEGHTGTDPLGRAIGPAEDHTKVKRVRDEKGRVVTPERPATATPEKD